MSLPATPATPAARLAASVRRLTRSAPATPPASPDEPPGTTLPIERWRYQVDRRLAALERRHDASARRQTLLILTTIVAEIGLEILKHR